jgi:hypothetical protein
LHPTAPVTLLAYYKKFASVSGALAAATGLGPLLSALLPGAAPSYLFPALGDLTTPARFGVALLAATITYFCFYAEHRPASVLPRFLMFAAIAFLALCCYLISFQHFVRKIDVPVNSSAVFVSVGYERTGFATQTFHDESDWNMLRARGTSDEEVSQLWTARSLDVARLCLFASYCGFILPLVLVFSLGVRYQM